MDTATTSTASVTRTVTPYDARRTSSIQRTIPPFRSQTFALRGAGPLQYAYFTTVPRGRVEVLALIGYSEYVDRTLDAAEARNLWRRLIQLGWQKVATAAALQAMPITTLQLHIYD